MSRYKSFPGQAIYHEGMDLIAVVSTGEDVWELRVTGQLINETWSNIGVRWEPNKEDAGLHFSEKGGLQVGSNSCSRDGHGASED